MTGNMGLIAKKSFEPEVLTNRDTLKTITNQK